MDIAVPCDLFKRKLKPFYRKESGRFIKVEGDYKYWELDECLNQYFKTDTGNPVRKNLEFFIPLRNKIEHRSMPELDASIFGECQAMLLNFDEMLEKELAQNTASVSVYRSRYNCSHHRKIWRMQ